MATPSRIHVYANHKAVTFLAQAHNFSVDTGIVLGNGLCDDDMEGEIRDKTDVDADERI